MIDGLISRHPVEFDGAFGSAPPYLDAVEAGSRAEVGRSHRPDRPHAYAALAIALVEAGLVEAPTDDRQRAPYIDLVVLKAITERQGLPGPIGRLIREYLGSLSEITSAIIPTSILVHGTIEVSRWCHEVGRLSGGAMEGRAC